MKAFESLVQEVIAAGGQVNLMLAIVQIEEEFDFSDSEFAMFCFLVGDRSGEQRILHQAMLAAQQQAAQAPNAPPRLWVPGMKQ